MRVALKTKNKGIKVETYSCRKCSEPIKAGEKYYQWQHKHQAPSRQHQSHGAPRQSELCTGKMSGVYAAIESVSDAINTGDPSSLADALNSAAESVREVAQEYEDNRSNMPESLQDGPTGTEMQDKSEALNTFADELESAASDSDIESYEMDEEEPDLMDDHTDACALTKKVETEGESEEETCDCGYNAAEEKHAAWEQERDDKQQAAFDCAQNAIDSLSI